MRQRRLSGEYVYSKKEFVYGLIYDLDPLFDIQTSFYVTVYPLTIGPL